MKTGFYLTILGKLKSYSGAWEKRDIIRYLGGGKLVRSFFSRTPTELIMVDVNRSRTVKGRVTSDFAPLTILPTEDNNVNRCQDTETLYNYYSCPVCKGRLFAGFSFCPWCGVDIADFYKTIDITPEQADLLEYIGESRQGRYMKDKLSVGPKYRRKGLRRYLMDKGLLEPPVNCPRRLVSTVESVNVEISDAELNAVLRKLDDYF